jgi:DNA-binding transcriptional ArsR family regulator
MERDRSEALDRTFGALSDATRRRIWRILGEHPGASTSELSAAFPLLSRWAVMKHLRALREADLVQTLPEGRSRRHYRVDSGLDEARAWLRTR